MKVDLIEAAASSYDFKAMDIHWSDTVLQDAPHIQFRAASVIYVTHYRKQQRKRIDCAGKCCENKSRHVNENFVLPFMIKENQ